MNICLCLHAKNEERVIGRLIDSCLPIISSYFILIDDTTTDDTESICKQKLANLPGVIQKWKNNGLANGKQKIFNECEAGYALIMDAKDEIVVKDKLPKLTADGYYLMVNYGGIKFQKLALCSLKKQWTVVHKKHAFWTCPNSHTENLKELEILSHPQEGARSHVEPYKKYMQDAIDIEQEILNGDDSARNRYYLAQSYKDAGENEIAIVHFDKRIKMGGWSEEVYMSMYYKANCKWKATNVFPLEDFIAAYNFRPTRLEALYQIVRHYRLKKQYAYAYALASQGAKVPYPENDRLFVEFEIWDWRMKDELAVCAYWIGEYKESERLCDELLSSDKLPENEVARVSKNRDYAIRKRI